jgi:hypothetical protein
MTSHFLTISEQIYLFERRKSSEKANMDAPHRGAFRRKAQSNSPPEILTAVYHYSVCFILKCVQLIKTSFFISFFLTGRRWKLTMWQNCDMFNGDDMIKKPALWLEEA